MTRPHDIDVSNKRTTEGIEGTVDRIVALGFEIRIVVSTPDDDEPVTVQLTRGQAQELDVKVGDQVWLRAYRGTTTTPDPSSSVAATA
jgi:sulfate transport system ATP-binding protein